MSQFLESIETLAFFTWVRESSSVLAYPTVLAFHAFGMALLVGLSLMIALRVMGFASGVPLAPMDKFYPIIWVGFWVSAVSGGVLYAQAALTFTFMPMFYRKLLAVAGAVVCVRLLRNHLSGDTAGSDMRPIPTKAKVLAGTSLILWLVAILAGRLTAYAGDTVWQTVLAVVLLAMVVINVRSIAARVLAAYW
jgi:hypothetical protein